jgi:hypothetical protein
MEVGEKRKLSLRKSRLLINGDDCLFPANHVTHQVWLALCPWFGMLPSIGKYYWSDDFCNINSTTYLWNAPSDVWTCYPETSILYRRCANFSLVKYVNYGILLNVKRSGGKMGTENIFDPYYTFSSNSYELLEGFPERLLEPCYNQYLRDFGRFAKKINLKLPWFVSKEFGGVGLAQYKEHRATPLDRACCDTFRVNQQIFPTIKKDTPWVIHSEVMKYLDQPEMSEDSSSYDEWYGYAVKSHFHRCCATGEFSKLYVDTQKDVSLTVRRCEKLWSKMVKNLPSTANYHYKFERTVTNLYPVLYSSAIKCENQELEIGEPDVCQII